MNLAPPRSRFSSTVAPKRRFLSLDVKCDQQTHKNDLSNHGINLKKIIQQSPITILRIFVAGEFTQKFEADFFAGFDSPIRSRLFFCWVQGGFLWVWIMGSQNVMGSGYGSNICVLNAITKLQTWLGWRLPSVPSKRISSDYNVTPFRV